jgi:hypothetical protein
MFNKRKVESLKELELPTRANVSPALQFRGGINGTPKDLIVKTKTKESPWQKVFTGAGKLTPFLSNISNAFSKPGMPTQQKATDYITAPRVDFSAQRNEVDRELQGMNKAAYRNLDENSAAAVLNANLTQGIRAKNEISEKENNANTLGKFETAKINAGIQAGNNGMIKNYQNELLERDNTMKSMRSANLSNAVDKKIAIDGEERKAALDTAKLGIYGKLFENSGVMSRLTDYATRFGTENGLDLELLGLPPKQKKKMGGRINKFKKVY